jgi:transposase
VLRADVVQVLGPTLVAGDVVMMNNVGTHTVAGSREAMAPRVAQGIYWPPYAPDLCPIEPCWPKVTTTLRKAKARTRETLERVLKQVSSTMTAVDARYWFAPYGYTVQ